MKNPEREKQLAAKEAVRFIGNDQVVGLGSGSTAFFALVEIGELVKKGLRIRGVPTSEKTRIIAESLNIPLVDIHKVDSIDITIDGADEFDRDLALIKGGGGALLREKVVAALTKNQIIIADSFKKVEKLGRFKIPVEVIPFASTYVINQLKNMGGKGTIRQQGDTPYLTDQGNYIVDTDFGLIDNPVILGNRMNCIVGLVEHGLFVNLVDRVIMGTGDTTETYLPK